MSNDDLCYTNWSLDEPGPLERFPARRDCTAPSDTYLGYRWDLHNDGTITTAAGQNLANTGAVDADIDWLEAYSQLGAFTGSARIGILDTGILSTHQDLSGKLVAQYDFYSRDGVANDQSGHGSHVAGIAAAKGNNGYGAPGVAWGSNVKLVVARVCGNVGCPTSAIASGIRWAVDNGAHVINLSLGGATGSSTERAALQYARANNVLPFCAAGNGSGPVNYPAAFPECVAVSATNWSDGLASYSSFGPEVELAAPGGDQENGNGYSYILSSYRSNNSSYAFMAGTSMATPEAAGLAALLHALGVTDDDAKLARMKATADDLGAPGTDNQFGAGRINVYRAINNLVSPPVNLPSPPAPQCANGADDDSDGKTDYPADPGCSSATDDSESPDPPPPPVSIQLTVTKRTSWMGSYADLRWSGATGTSVGVFRNGSLRTTTANDGAHSDNVGYRPSGSFRYKVCLTVDSTCSPEVAVTY